MASSDVLLLAVLRVSPSKAFPFFIVIIMIILNFAGQFNNENKLAGVNRSCRLDLRGGQKNKDRCGTIMFSSSGAGCGEVKRSVVLS